MTNRCARTTINIYPQTTLQRGYSPSTSSSGKTTGGRYVRTSGIVQSPLYMNLVVTARTGISARGNQLCRDLHISKLSGVLRQTLLLLSLINKISSKRKRKAPPAQSSAFLKIYFRVKSPFTAACLSKDAACKSHLVSDDCKQAAAHKK